MRSLSPLSRRILKKAGIAAAFFCSAFLFGSVLSHFTCRALRKAAPVFLSVVLIVKNSADRAVRMTTPSAEQYIIVKTISS